MLVRRSLETFKKRVSHFDLSLSCFGFRKVRQVSRGTVRGATSISDGIFEIQS